MEVMPKLPGFKLSSSCIKRLDSLITIFVTETRWHERGLATNDSAPDEFLVVPSYLITRHEPSKEVLQLISSPVLNSVTVRWRKEDKIRAVREALLDLRDIQ